MTMATARFTEADARKIGTEIGIDWNSASFDVAQFLMGLEVELEHGAHDPQTNVTDDDELLTGKIAWAHLKELPDYYTRLVAMEAEVVYLPRTKERPGEPGAAIGTQPYADDFGAFSEGTTYLLDGLACDRNVIIQEKQKAGSAGVQD